MPSPSKTSQGSRIRGLLMVVGLLFSVLILRLFYLQIATFKDYARESDENRIAQKRIKAPRGLVVARNGEVLARNRASYTIFLIPSTAENDKKAVSALQEAIGGRRITYNRNWRSPRLKRDVDFRTVSIVEERLRADWPLGIEIEPQRAYPYKTLAAHVLGYVGELHEKELKKYQEQAYVANDFVGKTGVEKVFEETLHGQDGVRYIEVDARGRTRKEFPEREQPVQPGNDLRLTIDMEVQQAAERALPDSMAGSVVALDPQTGAVLALASKPAFDPNVFVSFQEQKKRRKLLQDENKPLLNRAISGTYPPGSTMKMLAAVAALEAGITDTLSTFEACAGSLAVGNVVFRCFKRDGHGELNLVQAIEASCNIYFQHLAQILTIETWRDYASRFGFGHKSRINLDPVEETGLLPSRRYYQEKEGWAQGHLMNLVIGQGAMLATPIQMARYVAALANGGYLVTPYVSGKAHPRQPIEGISPSTFEITKIAMLRVVYGQHGTGPKVRLQGIQVAGKTGTAQVPNRSNDDAWFVAFAPYEQPEIAVAVVVEGGGGGGSVAGPIARQTMEAYFGIEASAARGRKPTDSELALSPIEP